MNTIERFKSFLAHEKRKVCIYTELSVIEYGSELSYIMALAHTHNENWNETWDRGFKWSVEYGDAEIVFCLPRLGEFDVDGGGDFQRAICAPGEKVGFALLALSGKK